MQPLSDENSVEKEDQNADLGNDATDLVINTETTLTGNKKQEKTPKPSKTKDTNRGK